MMLLYDVTVCCYCMLLLYDVTVWCYCMMLLYDVTVWCYCVMLLCDVTVWCYCVMLLCDVTVWCHCMMSLYDVTVWCHCMMSLYDVTVWCYCMMLVIQTFPLSVSVLSTPPPLLPLMPVLCFVGIGLTAALSPVRVQVLTCVTCLVSSIPPLHNRQVHEIVVQFVVFIWWFLTYIRPLLTSTWYPSDCWNSSFRIRCQWKLFVMSEHIMSKQQRCSLRLFPLLWIEGMVITHKSLRSDSGTWQSG